MRYFFKKFFLRQGLGAKNGNQAGLTLVEVMVALVIALILGAGIYQIFAGTQRTFTVNRSLGTLQDDGRFAMYVLRSEIRGAGYMGCQSENFNNILSVDIADYPTLNFRQAVYGLEADGTGWLDNKGVTINPSLTGLKELNLTNPTPLPGNDILVVRGVRPFLQERKVSDDPADYLTTEKEIKLAPAPGEPGYTPPDPPTPTPPSPPPLADGGGDVLVAGSCKQSVLFESKSYSGNLIKVVAGVPAPPSSIGNSTDEFGTSFEKGSTILIPQTQIFYVGAQENGEPGLFRKIIGSGLNEGGGFSLTTQPELIASGVERFLVRYYGEGVNEYGASYIDPYESASKVDNWANVRSIRIGLLMRSEEVADNLATLDTAKYYVSGDDDYDFEAPGDRRLRMVFTGTITLRNRVR